MAEQYSGTYHRFGHAERNEFHQQGVDPKPNAHCDGSLPPYRVRSARFPKTPHPVPAMSSVKSQRGASAEFFLKSCLCLFSFPAGSDFQNVFLALSKRVGLLLLLSVHGPVRDGTS